MKTEKSYVPSLKEMKKAEKMLTPEEKKMSKEGEETYDTEFDTHKKETQEMKEKDDVESAAKYEDILKRVFRGYESEIEHDKKRGVTRNIKKEELEQLDKVFDQKRTERLVDKLSSMLHDEWRASRKKEDGTYESRIKGTKDQEWIKKHGTKEVDIANTDFAELPEDWQIENKASAFSAMEYIRRSITLDNRKLDDSFIEELSVAIHNRWRIRREFVDRYDENDPKWDWAKPLMVSYDKLPEEEKEKDRVIARKAVEVFQTEK